MNLTLEILLLLATLPLIYHSLRSVGGEQTYIFWSAGLVFGVTREYTIVFLAGLYSYQDFQLVLFEFPIIYLVLWSNFSYLARVWTNHLLGREYDTAQAWDYHQPIIFLVLVCISFVLETSFAQYQMIHWDVDSARPLWEGTPLLAPFAWGFSGSLFLKGMKLMGKSAGKQLYMRVWNTSLIQPVLVLILMGLLLVINTLIVLVFS